MDKLAALGAPRREPLHRWDLNTGIPAGTPHRDLRLTVGGAAVALARHCGGVAIDMYGFPFNWPEDLLPA